MALTNATTLADYGAGIGTQGATLKVDATNKRVGVGTDSPAGPEGSLQVGTGITFFGNTGIVSAIGGKFSGDFTVGGTLTYEDVANIDAVGIITAQSHVSIADSILHTGDTDTSIRFPAAGTFTVETNGSERLRTDSGGRLLIGSTSARANTFNASAVPQVQVEGTNANLASIGIFCSASDVDGGRLLLAHQRSGGVGGNTIVNNGDQTGTITFQGNDGSEFVESAAIKAEVDGAPGANDMPGRLIFSTTADGATSSTERMRISNDGTVRIGDGSVNAAGVGAGPTLSITGAAPEITIRDSATGTPYAWMATNDAGSLVLSADQGNNAGSSIIDFRVDGTERLRITSDGRALLGHTSNINNKLLQITTSNGAALGLLNYQATDDGPEVTFIKSRNGTKGSHTVVNNGDFLGRIFFRGSDGDSYERGVEIAAQVDGTPGDGDMPGRLIISTTADGASTPTERVRITSTGQFNVGSGSFVVESDGDISTNVRGHGHIELDSTGSFSSPKVKLYSNTGNAEFAGTVEDSIGDLRSIPMNTQSSSASYTLQASDAGKTVHVHTTTTTVVVPNSVFSAGDAVSIVNGDGSNTPTISQGSGFSLRNTGDGTSGNRTLGVFGMATIYFTGAGVGYISGSGMT